MEKELITFPSTTSESNFRCFIIYLLYLEQAIQCRIVFCRRKIQDVLSHYFPHGKLSTFHSVNNSSVRGIVPLLSILLANIWVRKWCQIASSTFTLLFQRSAFGFQIFFKQIALACWRTLWNVDKRRRDVETE